MCADIEDGHAGAEESLDESALGELESAVDHGAAHIIAPRQKPVAKGEPYRKRDARKNANPPGIE
jgi:hypothetical protein